MEKRKKDHIISGDKFYLLVDFDNFFEYRPDADSFDWLQVEFDLLLKKILQLYKDIDYFDIRLYGGWKENGKWTRLGSVIQQAVASFNFFPIKDKIQNKIIRGKIELVTRLIAVPFVEWDDTVTTRSGIPRLRLMNPGLPEGCISDNENCPIRLIYRFSRKRIRQCSVPGCPVNTKNAFKVVEQKMVDTMLSCDVIHLSNDEDVFGMMVISDDFDLLPPMAMALQNMLRDSKPLVWMRTNDNYGFDSVSNLQRLGLNIQIWED